ncbi:hypothetical protein [Phenylobacterium sp.]|uniref:hypothetical protein n=1 Tax=Phenylobacterium sp. TaxID=1871053 RepID=UPI00398399AA
MTRKPSKAPAGPRVAYLVLGMHRSGTSAVTQLLALAGAELPAHVMPGDAHNAKGYFEPWKIALLNDERLRAAGSAWDDVFAFPFRPLGKREERLWLNRAESLFLEEYGEARHPLLKDPRVTVLLPVWRTVLADLEVAARCVIPVRGPLAVAGSLARRDGFETEKSVLLWTAYMLAAEAYSRDLPRAFVGYDALLADWRAQVARIEAAHGAQLPKLTAAAGREIDGFLSPELRHNDDSGDLTGLGWVGEIAQQVLAWFEAAAAGDEPDRAPLDRAATTLTRRRDEVGVLLSPVTRDLDVARFDLRETRARLEAEQAQARAERQELESTLQRDREVLETGWRADLERLEAEKQAEARRLEAGLQALEAEKQAEAQRLEAGLQAVRLAMEAVSGQKDEIAAQREQLVAQRAELLASLERDRKVLEAGWRADVEELEARAEQERKASEAQREALEKEARRDRLVLEQGWRADVDRLEAAKAAETESLTAELRDGVAQRQQEREALVAERQQEREALVAERQQERRVLESGWRADVAQLDAAVGQRDQAIHRLEAHVAAFRQTVAEAEAQLDAVLADAD